uniref:BTB domain-containing protein n=1 Tax=Panagrellus redivivus TaxID=6233 RepID=A0A7E4V456_PANRE
MVITYFRKTIRDSCPITINEADLTEKKVGETFESSLREVSCDEELRWNFKCYPNGDDGEAQNHVSVFIHVDARATVGVVFAVQGTTIQNGFYHVFEYEQGRGLGKFVSHDDLRPHFRDGKVTITCNVSFKFRMPLLLSKHSIVESCEAVPTDCELVVGSDSVKVHKNLLQFIAPGLYANFLHNTVEARSGKIVITDFDYKTVKSAMAYFYGCTLKDQSVETVVGILRFADKYNIKSTELESVPCENINVDSFCTITHYAFDCCKDNLLRKCGVFFKTNQEQLKSTKEFANLPPAAIVAVLKNAFGLQNENALICYAHQNGIPKVIDYLEAPLLASLSVENFCDVALYAWNLDREDLKIKCAKFFYDNRTEITTMPAFHELGNIALEVMKASLVEKVDD